MAAEFNRWLTDEETEILTRALLVSDPAERRRRLQEIVKSGGAAVEVARTLLASIAVEETVAEMENER